MVEPICVYPDSECVMDSRDVTMNATNTSPETVPVGLVTVQDVPEAEPVWVLRCAIAISYTLYSTNTVKRRSTGDDALDRFRSM